MGLGLHGGGVEDALFFIKEGADVTVTDLKTRKKLRKSIEKLEQYEVSYTLGEHKDEDFKNADIVIKNPGVPQDSYFIKIAKKRGAAIYDSMGIFFQYADIQKMIGVTGTKGKSSTSALIHEALKTKYPDAYITGLPGSSPLSIASDVKNSYGVIELSSWRLEGINPIEKSPHIAVITNIQEDHLNRYKSYEAYRKAKEIIFKFQNENDFLVLNYDDEYLRNIAVSAPSKVFFYSAQTKPETSKGEKGNINTGAYIRKNKLYIGKKKIGDIGELGLDQQTQHIDNVLATITVANLLDLDIKKTTEAIVSFKGLPGRLEHVGTLDQIDLYNDTTATNPYAVTNSLKKFKNKKVGLILGGEDKKLDYAPLVPYLKDTHSIALLPGSASVKIDREIKKDTLELLNIKKTATLREAIWWNYANKPDVILLSPGAASFNMFKNEFDRGDEFKRIATEVGNILKPK